MIPLVFHDTATLYFPTPDDYGKDDLGSGSSVPAILQQAIGKTHSNSQDALDGASILYLPSDNPTVIANHYRLEGAVVMVNPFGESADDQYFKITNASPLRDTLLDNEVRHIECDLQKISNPGLGVS